MRHLHGLAVAILAGLATRSSATEVVYVTDLEIYTLLAPCVASAISYDIFALTYSTACGDSETDLQSCVCSNTADFKSVYSSISTDVTYSCGSSATDDIWSASKMMDQYCDQDSMTVTFSSPTTNIVNAYITDLPEMDYLPPCAQSALSEAVMGPAAYRCPEAAELLAPCVCSKEDVVSDVSATIRSSVKYSCSNNQDVTSAQHFYNEYCAMNKGTTRFATPDGPPGDMTYQITALSQFKSLRHCAQSAVSDAIFSQSSWLCGSGPQELASCVCIKSGMSNYMSSILTSEVKWSCDSTATADVSSAVAVWDYYCSAAESKVVATVSESIAHTYPTASSRAGSTAPAQTGSGSKSGASSSLSPSEAAASDDGSSSDNKDESKSVSIVPIAGGIAGAVAVVAVGLGLFLFWRRKRRQATRGEVIPSSNGGDAHEYNGPPELMGSTHLTPGMGDDKKMYGVSELSTGNSSPRPPLYGGIKPSVAELPLGHTVAAELQSQSPPVKGYYPPPNGQYGHPSPQSGYAPSPVTPHGLQNQGGYGFQPSPQLQNGQPVYEVPAHPPPAAQRPNGQQQNTTWQAGPVEAYELDSNVGRWAK
ncbi:hypothetical protein AK830_g3241 [Neonectria ditissima]|uniref:Extracellular membrane protein CFEM domain-containing protein n=1 Tax=Neonectria ditissima TaxID=78410 RepID=A0A0P7BCC2_9HYPO|nr:hypothetical protein AK830_g3241 [Neonectria ditissima]